MDTPLDIQPNPAPQPVRFVVGVDIGLTTDHSAVVVVAAARTTRIEWRSTPGAQPPTRPVRLTDPHHDVVLAERIPLGTPYATVIARLCAIVRRLPPRPRSPLVAIDASGVGRPLVDQARRALADTGVPLAGVLGCVITAGSNETWGDAGFVRVAKRALVTRAQARLQADQLRIAAGLPQADILVQELSAFQADISAAGHATFGGKGEHDDLVMALMLAIWAAEQEAPRQETTLVRGVPVGCWPGRPDRHLRGCLCSSCRRAAPT